MEMLLPISVSQSFCTASVLALYAFKVCRIKYGFEGASDLNQVITAES